MGMPVTSAKASQFVISTSTSKENGVEIRHYVFSPETTLLELFNTVFPERPTYFHIGSSPHQISLAPDLRSTPPEPTFAESMAEAASAEMEVPF